MISNYDTIREICHTYQYGVQQTVDFGQLASHGMDRQYLFAGPSEVLSVPDEANGGTPVKAVVVVKDRVQKGYLVMTRTTGNGDLATS